MSALGPITAQGLGDRIYDAIRTAIIQNELTPGQRLSDLQLAERLKVSRTPVREALHRLQGVGLVQPGERSGYIVSPFSEQEIREVFEVRRLLEPLGIDKLEKEPDPVLLERIVTSFSAFHGRIPLEEYDEYFQTDHAFHLALVHATGNRQVLAFYKVIETQIDRGRHFLIGRKEGRLDATLHEHNAVCDALRAGDFDRARAALLHHLRTGEELMIEVLRDREERA
jgi:DNA-binding GntR family transcriptional regulator